MPIVYVLTNPAMPNLVKIGCTERSIEERLRELASVPGVPLPFECFLAVEVEDFRVVERALHHAFGDHRINQRREFFKLSPDKPAAILNLFKKADDPNADVTPKEDVVSAPEEQEALNRERQRRARFNFSHVGLPPGTILHSVFDPNQICTVVDERLVEFRGSTMSLSSSALIVAKETGRDWPTLAGPLYWMHEGKTLSDLRDELEEAE